MTPDEITSDWKERAELWKRECQKSDAKLAKIKKDLEDVITLWPDRSIVPSTIEVILRRAAGANYEP